MGIQVCKVPVNLNLEGQAAPSDSESPAAAQVAQEKLFIIVFVISYTISQHDYDIIRNIIVFGMISIAQ